MKIRFSDIFHACVTGIGFGIPITLVCMTLIGGYNGIIREFLIWTMASALFGVLTILLLRVPNELPLLAATALHCIGCMVVAAGAGALIGYADTFWELLLGILPVFVVVYGVLYGLSYRAMKKEASRINEELNKK